IFPQRDFLREKGFTDTSSADHLMGDDRHAVLLEESRNNLVIYHAAHLKRNAGHRHENFIVSIEPHSGRRAEWIGYFFAAFRQRGLLPVEFCELTASL